MARDIINFENDFNKMRKQMDTLMENFELIPFGFNAHLPYADLYETDDEVVASIELPGFDKKNIKLEVRDDALYIRGETTFEKEDTQKGYHQKERRVSNVSRTLPLPVRVDEDNVKAHFNNGVLEVHMPKMRKEKDVKYIDIN